MCKANGHTEDSNAKTLSNSCLEAARFVPENRGIHAEKSRYPCSKATIFMPEWHENHFQAPRKSCSIAAGFTQKFNPSVVDPHGITRRRRFAPANPQLGSAAPPAIIVALQTAALRCRVPGNSPTSLSGTVGQWIALLAIGRRRCDSASRSFLCARALPQRSRLRFRAVSEFS